MEMGLSENHDDSPVDGTVLSVVLHGVSHKIVAEHPIGGR